jgi:hypothetical protein
MNVYSDFFIPAFGRHVTISRFEIKSFLKFVTVLYVSGYLAIIRWAEIRAGTTVPG